MTVVNEVTNVLQWPDYVVFVIFLLISAGIGIFFSLAGGKQKSTGEFLMGDRSLSLIPVTISILVSFTSAILILGSPSEIYLNGAMYLFYPFGKLIACILSGFIFVPLFYPLQLTSSFEAEDYIVVFIFLLISTVIGVSFMFIGGRQKTLEEFLMGNRALPVIPVATSMLLSSFSGIFIVTYPAEIYLHGGIYIVTTYGVSIAYLLVAFSFLPLFYSLKLTSTFEYLELRFRSRMVRLLGNFLYLLSSILYMGIAMYAPSSAMDKVTAGGFPVFASIAVCGAIGTFYTTLGGIKAVVWTDVFQAGIMLAGLIAIIVKGTIEVGGVDRVFQLNYQYGRLNFTDDSWSFDPRVRHTIWGLTIGTAIGWMGTYGVNQAAVQRYCALPSLKKARLSVLLNIPGSMLLIWLTCAAGLVIFAYYASIACDIYGANWAKDKNQIVPYFVMDQLFYPTIPGIFLASLFSGALSSISSSLNACSAITWKDVLQPYVFKDISEAKATWITKGLVLFYGILGTGFGFVASGLGGTVLQASLAFTGAVGAPSLGIFLLGALFPHSNKWGAFVGAIVGLAISLWLSIGAYSLEKQEVSLPANTTNCNITEIISPFTTVPPPTSPPIPQSLDDFYSISYLWYTAFGALITIVVGLLVTGLTGPMRDTDPKYVIPIFHKFCCCFPSKCRTCFNCGIGPDDRELAFEELAKNVDEKNGVFAKSNEVYMMSTDTVQTNIEERDIELTEHL